MTPPSPSAAGDRLAALGGALAVIVALAAGSALVGWCTGASALASLVPGETTMKVNTALGLLMAAAALWLAARAPQRRRLLDGLAAGAVALAGLTLVEYIAGVDAGIDQLLFTDHVAPSHPGRMAPGTAAGLAVFGATLLLLDRAPRWRRALAPLILGVGLLGLVVVVSYASGRPQALTVPGLTTIALPTGLCFAALALGLLLARPEREPVVLLTTGQPGAAFVLRLVPLVVLGPLVMAPVIAAGQRAGLYDSEVERVLLIVALPLLLGWLLWAAARQVEGVETLREQALRDVATAERRLSRTLETAHEAFVGMDAAGRITAWNPAAEHIFGWTAAEAIGRELGPTIVPEALRDAHRAGLARFMQAGEGPVLGRLLELEALHRDGHEFPIELTIAGDRDGETWRFNAFIRDISVRKEAEQELRLQAEVTATMAEGVVLIRVSDTAILHTNARFDELFGYQPGELVGRDVSIARAPNGLDSAAFAAETRQGLPSAGSRWSGTVHNVRKDGTEFWCRVNVSAFDHPIHGTVAVAAHTDITEQRAAEGALRESEERFRLMVEGVQDYAILMLDVDGNIVTWNAGARRLKGYAADEIIGRHFSNFYPSEDVLAGKPDRELQIAIAEGSVRDEGWRVRKDGTQFWGDVLITALYDHAGTLRGFGKVTRDLTERRAAELKLQAAEERFRCAFDEAPIGMLIIGLDGRYQRVNHAFCQIVGYADEELIGLSRESITHPDDVAADAEAIRTMLAGEVTSSTRTKRYLHASGQPVWTEINATLIRDGEGRPLHFIAQVQDITERRRHEHQLQHMADHDPLTGLLNRRSFQRELDGYVARRQRYGGGGAVLMLDLDHFKYFNDTQGHGAGDELIVRIAHGLRARLRESDVLARLGGDEFAVLIPQEDEQGTQELAEALLQLVRDEAMPTLIGERHQVTASIGIARFDDGERLTSEEIMVNADLAMYDAKEAGRDRCARYRTEQHVRPKIESRIKWVEQIHHAIATDGFELFAQPIVPLAGNGPRQFELLLRMRDGHGDLIPPGSFLYIAERLGLIQEIDGWVTGRAIDMLAEQRAAGHDLRVEVNLSGHTIGDPGLLELIERRLRETGVPPDRLIFEITETAAIAHITRAAAFAERLCELGCGFALDDFGAGYGSFYYLKHLPFDYLKIDGEFVRHCAASETDRILISAVVQIARGMGKRTIAEFVGNQETVEVLTRLGVDYGQGYFLGRPEPLGTHLAAATPAIAEGRRGTARAPVRRD